MGAILSVKVPFLRPPRYSACPDQAPSPYLPRGPAFEPILHREWRHHRAEEELGHAAAAQLEHKRPRHAPVHDERGDPGREGILLARISHTTAGSRSSGLRIRTARR
jgi:hypothetical protein